MSKNHGLQPLCILTLVLAVCSSLFAQSGSQQANNPDPPQVLRIGAKRLDEPSWKARFLRSWQYNYQLLEQPEFIVATNSGVTSTVLNPNKYLQQHSLVFQFSELFPRASSLPDLVKAWYDADAQTHSPYSDEFLLDTTLCAKDTTAIQCLARGEKRWWWRAVTGAKLTFSVQQRNQVQQGVFVANLPVSQGWGWNGQIDFTPDALFITSASWKNALSVFGKGADGAPRNISWERIANGSNMSDGTAGCLIEEPINNKLVDCVKEFATPKLDLFMPPKWNKFAAILIPAFQLKFLSQFDFIRQGGILVDDPRLQRSIKDFSMTWDLRCLIPSTADRITVATLYTQKLKESPRRQPVETPTLSKLCVLTSGTGKSYIPVPKNATADFCRNLADRTQI